MTPLGFMSQLRLYTMYQPWDPVVETLSVIESIRSERENGTNQETSP